jgi:CDP-diacylglycerol--glycerol-3-phosphate 3-phosphatidyltransferase
MNTVEARESPQKALLKHLGQLPNQLTAIRLALVPLLWILALTEHTFYLGLGVALACLTDALDGIVARKLNLVSDFGARFDSLADNLLARRPSSGC